MEDAVRKFACLLVATLLIGSGCGGGGGGGGNSTRPLKPVADAGTSQTVPVNVLVQLDGSRSASPGGGLLTYQWTLVSRPAGSASTLNNGTVANPTFTPDTTGSPYVLRLVVNDGVSDSDFDEVTITAIGVNVPPVAYAGPNQNVLKGSQVFLDANQNQDGKWTYDADGDSVTYAWSIVSTPNGSAATLSDSHAARTDFVADLAGAYVFGLMVYDGEDYSDLSYVTITAYETPGQNAPPVADAGPNQRVLTGASVTLDGGGSYDANGDPLTYTWTILSIPADSHAVLSNLHAGRPTFTADVSGSYVFTLRVSDGTAQSNLSFVVISAVNPLIEIVPSSATLFFFPPSNTIQLRLIGHYSDGTVTDLTEDAYWSMSLKYTAWLDLSNSPGSKGFVTAGPLVGVAQVHATYQGYDAVATIVRE
jgi:hypothetical protein